MRLPSLSHVFTQSVTTAKRFPFTILSGLQFSISFWMIVEETKSTPFHYWDNLLLSSLLGLPLFTGIVFWIERARISFVQSMLYQSLLYLLLLLYAFALPENVFTGPEVYVIRFLMLNAGFHLFVSFSPFMKRGELNGFWQFNKSLFLRFLTAGLYSAVLYVGLAIALAAIQNLFAIHVDPKWYGRLWGTIAGIFNTWFFLSGVPKDLDYLDREESYPKGLKIFTQYVLIPLVTIYLVILYAYLAKILLDWDWPKGWVGYLVLGFSTAGIFSLLLVWPVRNLTENIWINKYTKWFYVSLIPLIVLLFFAIARRINEYGLTERRTLVVILAIWLTGIVAYFLISKVRSIKIIPISLALLAFLLCYGPWSVPDISKNYQLNLLEQKLNQYNILVEGRIHPAAVQPSFEDRKNISSMVQYLVATHGSSVLQQWFDTSLDSLKNRDTLRYTPNEKPRSIVAAMGIWYVDEWEKIESYGNFYLTANAQDGFTVHEYTHYLKNIHFALLDSIKEVTIDNTTYLIKLDSSRYIVSVRRLKAGKLTEAVITLDSMVANCVKKYSGKKYIDIPLHEMKVNGSSDQMRVVAFFSKVDGKRSEEKLKVESVTFDMLIGDR